MTTLERMRVRKSMTPLQRLTLCYGCPFPCNIHQKCADVCQFDLRVVLLDSIEFIKKYAKKENEK